MPSRRRRCCVLRLLGCYQLHELGGAAGAPPDAGGRLDDGSLRDAGRPDDAGDVLTRGRCVEAELSVEIGPELGCTTLVLAPADGTAACETVGRRDGSETGRAMRIERHGRGVVTAALSCQEPGCFEREGFFVGPIVPDRCWSCGGYATRWDETTMDWAAELSFGAFQRDGFAEYIIRPHEAMTLRVCFEPYAL